MPKNEKIKTPRFRVSYQHVFRPQLPKENDPNGKPCYSTTMIFEKDADLTDLKRIINDAKIEKFGANPKGLIATPIRKGVQVTEDRPNGFDLEKNPEYKGKWIVTARSYGQAVGVCKIDKKYPKKDPRRTVIITDENEFYSGCYAIASLTAYGYVAENGKKRGVALSLQNIIKVAEGEPLVAKRNPHEDFSDMDDDLFDDDDDDDDDLDDDDDDDLGY
jgi:hypothetical protein